MTVSKRVRYEVLRRDGFKCRYCHASDKPLQVDHVVPVALGGGDGPDNLVASCGDCNIGKSSVQPDEPLVEDVRKDAMAFGRAVSMALYGFMESAEEEETYIEDVLEMWESAWDKYDLQCPPPLAWKSTARYWSKLRIPFPVVQNAFDVAVEHAIGRRIQDSAVFNYAKGILNNRTKSALAEAGKGVDDGS